MRFVYVCFTFILISSVAHFSEAFFQKLHCPDICNRNHGVPVSHCAYVCKSWIPVGKYYDGTPCYLLSLLGKQLNWVGQCSKGVCVKWKLHTPTQAQIHCGETFGSISGSSQAITHASPEIISAAAGNEVKRRPPPPDVNQPNKGEK
ncbi:uncharacterized protein LOC144141612 [Haemaphysalis longicornis]